MKNFFRPHLWLLRFIGLIVPRRLRADWRQEWEAELEWREGQLAEWERLDANSKLELLRHSAGAFADALWLQPRRWEDEMIQDLRFGLRILWKSPAFTSAVVLSLVIGIGATTAIFSIVNGIVLRPLPYRTPEELVRVWHRRPKAGDMQMLVSGGNVQVWRERAQSFAAVAAYQSHAFIFNGETEPEEVRGAVVSANLLPMLGYQPLLGRGFLPEEETAGKETVIVLSYMLWQRRFGGHPGILGRAITVDQNKSYTVVGVMPADVNYPGRSEYWVPETITARGRHDIRQLNVLGRLKPGVTGETANRELQAINQQLQREFPEAYRDWSVWAQPLHDSVVGKVRPTLLMLLGAVGFVLLIACANVANLLLVRAAARQREFAVRAALGAGRLRLLRQMLTESACLAMLGGAGGWMLAQGMVKALIALDPPNLPRLAQVTLDARVVLFTFVTTFVVVIVFGLLPAWQACKFDVYQSLKEGGAQKHGRRWLRWLNLRDALVIGQTALALVLLVGAGLLAKSFVRLRQVELGFEPSNALVMGITPPGNAFPNNEGLYIYYQRVLDAVKSMPGVESAALATTAPTEGSFMSSPIVIAGRPKPESRDAQPAFFNAVSADFFRTIGGSLRRGRFFQETDNETAPKVAIINETLARTYFAGENPLGHRIALRGEPDKTMEVVGVAADIKLLSLEIENKPAIYVPFRQHDSYLSLLVRSPIEGPALVPALRARIHAVDKFAAVTRVRTFDELISRSIAQPRFYALLIAVFAGIALTLALIGMYGVMAYTVSQRTHEIGVRMALGAEAGQIQHWIVRQGMLLIGVGLIIGLFVARLLTRSLADLLFGVKPTDLSTYGLIAAALMGAALIACWIPARRAARVDPMRVLRTE